MRHKPVLLVAVGLLIISVPMFAHHGSAGYDTAKLAAVKGRVTDFRFTNPHVEIYLDRKDDNGNVEKWAAEAQSPNMLYRQGWNINTLKIGDEITIVGAPGKEGSNILLLRKIVLANGQEFAAQGDY